jgi:hypothetical protein
VSIQLKLPEGYQASDGARFIVKFTKNRSFYGDDTAPLVMQLKSGPTGLFWEVHKHKSDLKDQIISLLQKGVKQKAIAEEVRCSAQYVTQVKQEVVRQGVLPAKGRHAEMTDEAMQVVELDGEGDPTESEEDESWGEQEINQVK